MVTMLKNKCSVWKRIKFPTFWYNCYYFTWSDTYFIQLETLLINRPSYMISTRIVYDYNVILLKSWKICEWELCWSKKCEQDFKLRYLSLFSVLPFCVWPVITMHLSFRRLTDLLLTILTKIQAVTTTAFRFWISNLVYNHKLWV